MMKRRHFIRSLSLSTLAASAFPRILTAKFNQTPAIPHVIWVENGEPESLVTTALSQFGGMNRFISKGDVVVVKPNIGWDKEPQYAANTNPYLIKKITELCFDAGAKEVKIFDNTCNNPRRCYRNSGIESLAEEAGANVVQMRSNKYVALKIENGKILKEWPVYKDYLDADKTINVPVAKHHSLCKVSLGLKNLMGVMGGNRSLLHTDFASKLIDIDQEIMPTLTIIDAYRVLTKNGPTGGNLADVDIRKTLIMSDCTISADYTALQLFDLDLPQVGFLREAVARGINRYDLTNLDVRKISLS
jgi:uncharacterized protein (DUF362 family)